tara:strand:+ start:103 stop:285 length:183 start_codon:yes stop_codon:yes gene_type:complete
VELFMKIGSAVLIGGMILLMFPNAKRMMKESPEAEKGDWEGFLIPIALVAAFVLLLMNLI